MRSNRAATNRLVRRLPRSKNRPLPSHENDPLHRASLLASQLLARCGSGEGFQAAAGLGVRSTSR